MTRNEDIFDKYLSKEVKEYVNSIEFPDKEKAWVNIKKEINNYNEKNKLFFLKKKIAIVATVIIIFFTGVMVGTSNYTNANFNFLKSIKNVFGNVTNISLSTHQDNKIEDQQDTVVNKKLYTVKQANKILNYDIILPKYIPQNYKLIGVYIRNEENNLSPVEIQYIYDTAQILISENPIIKQTAISHNVRNAETKKIIINGSEATFIYFTDLDIHEIFFQKSIMQFKISGSITEDEIIKIAKSIPNI